MSGRRARNSPDPPDHQDRTTCSRWQVASLCEPCRYPVTVLRVTPRSESFFLPRTSPSFIALNLPGDAAIQWLVQIR